MASSAVARNALPGVSVAAGLAAYLADRNRHVFVLENGRTASDKCLVAPGSDGQLLGLARRARRASIANVEYRTPDLYSRNQPRTNTVL